MTGPTVFRKGRLIPYSDAKPWDPAAPLPAKPTEHSAGIESEEPLHVVERLPGESSYAVLQRSYAEQRIH